MTRVKELIRKQAHLPVTLYMVSVMLYGMWSMMHYMHWLVPVALIGLAAVSGKTQVVYFNMGAAALLAVYGLTIHFAIAWYAVTSLLLAPVLVMVATTNMLSGRPARDQEAGDASNPEILDA